MSQLATECRKVYDAAVAVLGPRLGGYSALDLLADNFDNSLEELRAAMSEAGIK